MRCLSLQSVLAGCLLGMSFSATTEERLIAVPYDSAVHGRAYFGDPVQRLSTEERASFDRGGQLFARTWDTKNSLPRNARSCVTCHSVPSPGGSGMSNDALVSTVIRDGQSQVMHSAVAFDASQSLVQRRRTPPLFGVGLLEAADELQYGARRSKFLGALADHSSTDEVVSKAIENELGLATVKRCRSLRDVGKTCTADISPRQVSDLVTYVRYLAAPPVWTPSEATRLGEEAFNRARCAQCHVPSFSTLRARFPALRSAEIRGYTDFRSHDIGSGYRVRTAPLWGINSFGPPYMHNAAASSIDQAIRLHSGKAEDARSAYEKLDPSDRDALVAFLRSL